MPATPQRGAFRIAAIAAGLWVPVVILALGPSAADDPPGSKSDKQAPPVTVSTNTIHTTPIQVDVNMVVVNVTVTDPYDRIVTGLDLSNFQIYDEKVGQKIASFSTVSRRSSRRCKIACSSSPRGGRRRCSTPSTWASPR